MAGYETFEDSVFNHQTGTEIHFNKVQLVVLVDLIYGDDGHDLLIASEHKQKLRTDQADVDKGVVRDGENDYMQLSSFESILNDTDDSKFDQFFASLIEMEDVKKKFKDDLIKKTDPKGKAKVVGDESVPSKVKSIFEMDVDNFLIPKNKFHVYTAMPKRKAVRSVSDNSHIAYRTRSNVSRRNECVVIDIMKPAEDITAKPKRKACRSITATVDVVRRKRHTVKRLKTNAFFEFTKVAESRLLYRLPGDVASDLSLSVDNLRDVTIQNLRSELTNMSTRAEKSSDGYRYGFTKWSAFLKSNHIQFGSTLFFKYVKSSQILMLTKVGYRGFCLLV
ncbi:putative transcription factor B3-Domain family [Helianthus annuus]|nr:putative transcription factor B3-Domain family [Helianthus annuus]KAJ0617953.1 putative transcription factor B3-Domain family [Helianthus annuus]